MNIKRGDVVTLVFRPTRSGKFKRATFSVNAGLPAILIGEQSIRMVLDDRQKDTTGFSPAPTHQILYVNAARHEIKAEVRNLGPDCERLSGVVFLTDDAGREWPVGATYP